MKCRIARLGGPRPYQDYGIGHDEWLGGYNRDFNGETIELPG